MDKRSGSRIGLTAAAVFGAVATAAGVTGSTVLAADLVNEVSNSASATSAHMSDIGVASQPRAMYAPVGTEYFGPDDLVEEQPDTNGFSQE
jgi:2-hydroxychromene-2-carboxylate isomerase